MSAVTRPGCGVKFGEGRVRSGHTPPVAPNEGEQPLPSKTPKPLPPPSRGRGRLGAGRRCGLFPCEAKRRDRVVRTPPIQVRACARGGGLIATPPAHLGERTQPPPKGPSIALTPTWGVGPPSGQGSFPIQWQARKRERESIASGGR